MVDHIWIWVTTTIEPSYPMIVPVSVYVLVSVSVFSSFLKTVKTTLADFYIHDGIEWIVTLTALQQFRSETKTIKNIDKPIKGVRAPSIMPIHVFKSELARFRKCSWNSVVSLWHIGDAFLSLCVCLYVRRRIKIQIIPSIYRFHSCHMYMKTKTTTTTTTKSRKF